MNTYFIRGKISNKNLPVIRLYFKRTQYIKLVFGIKQELITDVYKCLMWFRSIIKSSLKLIISNLKIKYFF
jgi:hypothetical protein